MLSIYLYKSQYIARRTRLLSAFGYNHSLFHGPNSTPLWMKQSIAVADGLQSVLGVGHTGGRSLRKVLTSLHHIASTDNFQIHSTVRWRYNTRDTRKRTPYTQYPFQNILRHPRGGYLLYNGYCIYAAVLTPLRSLEFCFSFDPCMWGKYGNVVLRPLLFTKIWQNV